MKNKEMMKQMIDFNRTTFNSNYDTAMTIRDKAENMTSTFLADHPEMMPEAGKKIFDEWSASVKKGLTSFQENMNEGFNKFEDYFSA